MVGRLGEAGPVAATGDATWGGGDVGGGAVTDTGTEGKAAGPLGLGLASGTSAQADRISGMVASVTRKSRRG